MLSRPDFASRRRQRGALTDWLNFMRALQTASDRPSAYFTEDCRSSLTRVALVPSPDLLETPSRLAGRGMVTELLLSAQRRTCDT